MSPQATGTHPECLPSTQIGHAILHTQGDCWALAHMYAHDSMCVVGVCAGVRACTLSSTCRSKSAYKRKPVYLHACGSLPCGVY